MPTAAQLSVSMLAKMTKEEREAVIRQAEEKSRTHVNTNIADAKTVLRMIDNACEAYGITTPEIRASINVLESERGKSYIRIQPRTGDRLDRYTLFVLSGLGFRSVGHGEQWRLTSSTAGFAYRCNVENVNEPEPTNEHESRMVSQQTRTMHFQEPEPEQAVMQRKVRNSRKAAK